MKTLKINEAAKKLNMTPRAIRFYEEKGLLFPQKDTGNQYRLFTEQEIWRLQTIASLREMGLSIEDIKQMLSQIEKDNMNEIQHYLETQRTTMFSKWIEIKQMLQTLDQMIQHITEHQSIDMEQIVPLTESYRRLKDLRNHWKDRWNFDSQATTYDEKVKQKEADSPIHKNYNEVLDLTLQWIAPKEGEKGIDIGTGTGNLARRFVEQGIEMTGIDQSREMLKQCKQKNPQMAVKLGNFLAIPSFDNQYDFICTSFAIHHLTDDQKELALEEMDRILTSRGRICIVDLMFEHEQARQNYWQQCIELDNVNRIRAMEDEYYADRSRMLTWFHNHGYATIQQQVNELVHIVYAVKTH